MISQNITIAVDAMGGDFAPKSVIEGIELFLLNHKDKTIKFLVFGNQAKIESLSLSNLFKSNCTIVDTKDEVIGAHWKVAEALRQGQNTSMWKAVESVQQGQAHAVVSAGNTGALMVVSRKILGMLPNIDRPAIVGTIPSKLEHPVVFLDLGANAVCAPQNLAQFAIMGYAFCRVIMDNSDPKIALLNIGLEDVKGNPIVQQAADILQSYHSKQILNYIGFVESNHIYDGKADVIVTDGFSGNIALKALEGTTKFVIWNFKKAVAKSILAKIGIAFLLPALLKLRKQTDSRRYNGAMLIGLSGISVKAHGSSDKVAIASSLEAAYKLAVGDVNSKIEKELAMINSEGADAS